MRQGNKMETLKLSIVVIFAVCYSDEALNITYIEDEMTWNNATSYCFDNGGILESNETIVKEYSLNINEYVWIGSYSILTKWYGIWGCFTLGTLAVERMTPISSMDPLECQKRCPTIYDFFSVKDSKCYCLKERDLNRARFENCICSNCSHTHFFVYKQNINENSTGKSVIGNEDSYCMAASCPGKRFSLSKENCGPDFKVICEDGKYMSYESHKQGTLECGKRNSYIKWYSDELCAKHDTGIGQHWTSIKQEDRLFSLTIYDKGTHISPIECNKGKVENGNSKRQDVKMAACNELHSFFCRFGIATDEIIPPVNKLKEDNNDNTAGTIAGVVIAVIAVLVISIVLAAIIYKRRKKSRIPAVTKSNYDSSSPVNKRAQENRESTLYTEISGETDTNKTATHNTLVYSYAECLNSEKYPSPISETSNSRAHGGHLQTAYNFTDKHGSSENRGKSHNTHNTTMHNIPEHNQINSVVKATEDIHEDQNSEYTLAQRTDEDDEPDPYDTNIDYDHLSNVSKIEDKNTNNKVYDHLHVSETDDCDPTYDHSNINGSISTDSNYDHFNKEDHDLF